jgi:hypothetical protein
MARLLARCGSRSAFEPIRLGYGRGFLPGPARQARVKRGNPLVSCARHLHAAVVCGLDNTETVLSPPVSPARMSGSRTC